MTDTRGIDRFFDVVDGVIGKVARGLNGVDQVEDERKLRPDERSKQGSSGKKPRSSGPGSKPSSNSTALAKSRFRIDEVTDATTGDVIFIVTDGATARCELSSRATAEKILAQLQLEPRP